jgi:hypothetical protein
VRHWRGLQGAVHPDDRPHFESASHSFNLDWPPPAFLGDVVNAPFILLMMNGGYDDRDTPAEFADPSAVEAYLDRLHHPGPIEVGKMAPYYARANYAGHIASGRLALVNAVAYRSGKLSNEPLNKKLVEHLPSTALHRRWLREELVPQALAGERTIIAHRYGLWGLGRYEYGYTNIVFTRSGASPHLPRDMLSRLKSTHARLDSKGLST